MGGGAGGPSGRGAPRPPHSTRYARGKGVQFSGEGGEGSFVARPLPRRRAGAAGQPLRQPAGRRRAARATPGIRYRGAERRQLLLLSQGWVLSS